MSSAELVPHLDDGQLLQLVDRDDSIWDLESLDAHIQVCARCSEELAMLQRQAALVSGYVKDFTSRTVFRADTATARRKSATSTNHIWNGTWARAAVILLAVITPLIAVEPLRARIANWVTHQIAGLSGGSSANEAVHTTAAPARASASPARSVLWFTPSSSVLRIDVTARQQSGTLVLAHVDGTSASLEMQNGDGAVPIASDRGLQIDNAASSTATYVVHVPSNVQRVILSIGGEAPRNILAEDLPANVDLGKQ